MQRIKLGDQVPLEDAGGPARAPDLLTAVAHADDEVVVEQVGQPHHQPARVLMVLAERRTGQVHS
ncbi:hypothetical protein [Streptomyces rochei]|uniref:hypothetical protein n=1 Tax=Streptomyces rochei TaxID=1928 RepID=UPI0036312AAE